MPTRRCCCGPSPCLMYIDYFDRIGSDLGPDWTHDVGQWTTNFYAESQVDNARALYDHPHTVPDESAHVYMYILNETVDSGDVYRLIVNAVDEDNYHYAEFVRNGVSDSILRLGKRTGGSDAILKSQTVFDLDAPSGARYFTAKIADNEFCAEIGTPSPNLVFTETHTIIPLGYYAGMGADAGCRISEWGFLQHAQTNSDCQSCVCRCLDQYLPPVLNVNVHGEMWLPTGPIDEQYLAYAYDYDCDFTIEWSANSECWEGYGWCVVEDQDLSWYVKFCCPMNNPGLSHIDFWYECNTGGAPWTAGVAPVGTGTNAGPIAVEEGWSCTPLLMTYLSTIIPCYPGHAGEGYMVITITELP